MASQVNGYDFSPNGCDNFSDQVKGALLGLAAGDRNGGPIQMALVLAENLCSNQYNPEDVFDGYYQWYANGKRIGDRIKLKLNNGDCYIMSEKATGFDWKKRSKNFI